MAALLLAARRLTPGAPPGSGRSWTSANRARGLTFAAYEDLRSWSVGAGLEQCWSAVWDFFEVHVDNAVRARRRAKGDARRALVRRRAPQLRRARPAPGVSCATTTSPSWRSRRAASRVSADLGVSSPIRSLAPASGCSGSGSWQVIASPPTCPTSPRRSLPSWRRPVSGRRGPRALPSSACRRCSTGSLRSSRPCCSPSRAISTAVNGCRAATNWRRFGRACRACARRSSCRTPSRPEADAA